MREYIESEWCPVCLQMFYSRTKVINHLEEKSRRCRLVVTNCVKPLPVDPVTVCDTEDAAKARALVRIGRRRHYTDDPVVRLSGQWILEAFVVGLSHKTLLKTTSVMGDDDLVDGLRILVRSA